MTHYELLGVSPEASAAELRDAYRRAARQHHPDAGGVRSAEAMADINLAWWVLRDPDRRRAYDLSLTPPALAPEPDVADDDEPVVVRRPSYNPLARYQDPPRFPWRFMAILAAIGVAVVMIGVILHRPSKPAPPDNLLTPGSCIVVESNGDAAEVDCANPHDGVVATIVPFDEPCEADLEPHRDRQGLGIACVKMS
jgi:molecular chaperone DnaJ